MRIASCAFFLLLSLFATLYAGQARADTAGTMRYNAAQGKMEFFDGYQWYYFTVGLPVGVCAKPGEMDYNTLLGAYQVCNGTAWVQVSGALTLSVCTSPGVMDFDGSTFMVCNGLLWMDIKGSISAS